MARRKKSVFDVIEEFRRQVDSMFEKLGEPLVEEPPMYDVGRKELRPLTQINETEDEVVVTVDLPCVSKEDIKMEATDSLLKIDAPVRECVKFGPYGPVQRETEFDTFRKVIKLPALVKPKMCKARFKDGVLEIRLPKKIGGVRIQID